VQAVNGPDALFDAIKKGPVLSYISANNLFFRGYAGGIINNQCCFETKTLDHVVVAVGFGVEQGSSYIIYRNSWGETWGEAGYVRVTATNQG
jgi:C1A family cysteine protease